MIGSNTHQYLHIGQHWSALRIIKGVEHRPPTKLMNMNDIELLKKEPFNVNVRIDSNDKPSWGEEVYRINHDKTLTFTGSNYDTSD